MNTREEIEEAKKRRLHYFVQGSPLYPGGFIQREADAYTLADAYLADRQQRERDQQPPTREMFERLGATLDRFHVLTLKTIEWHAECHCPWLDTIQLNTIAKLRAACLLLGIETEGIL